jgi:hypothetical protein
MLTRKISQLNMIRGTAVIGAGSELLIVGRKFL